MSKKYEAKDIRVLEGLDAVRLRPGMYIGTTGMRGLHHLLWEIVDNSIDEISNGHGNECTVILHTDGSASVEDDGRGVPVDQHPKLGVSGVEVVFTQLHAGGKFDNDNYKTSGGLHGVGAAVANALSRWLTVSVYKKNKEYKIEFESVPNDKGDIKGGVPKYPLEIVGKTAKQGTRVQFLPDDRIFENITFNLDTVSRRLRELAFLNRGCKITLIDERVLNSLKQPFSTEYYYEGGLVDFVKYLNETRAVAHTEPIMIEGERDGVWMQLSMQYTDAYTENIFSYVNNIPTAEGGTHITGLKTALTRVLQDQAKKSGVGSAKKDPVFVGEDFREGLTAVLSIKMQNVEFEGQTKTKLGNPTAKLAVEALVQEHLSKYLDDNKIVCDTILKKAMLAAKVREAARREKENIRLKN
ncbi:MAG: ATP-binding protein, partial [Firmicutes bacterium]|nr:ATP-binding protein [Bacillota bacterium]